MEFLAPFTSKLHNIKLVISYDGTDFFGWQKTSSGSSVESILTCALEQILQEKIQLQAASRTDRGVHANGQVVNFFSSKDFDMQTLHRGLNAVLPPTIRVKLIEEMDLSFHPTLDAIGKEYHYNICSGPIQGPYQRLYSWHVYEPLNLKKIEEAIPFFLGEKDFSFLCNVRKNIENAAKVTEIFNISTVVSDNGLRFIISGKRFLYKMVRNIVGTLVTVGKGKMEPQDISLLFEKKDRKLAPLTAPAHGLFLIKIIYPEPRK